MNWVITGGCGFLGTALISKLKSNKDNKIRIIDNLSVGTTKDLSLVCNYEEIDCKNSFTKFCNKKIQFINGDILDKKLALNITKNADVIVHFAANSGVVFSVEYPESSMETNVIGAINYLEAARVNSCLQFVFASSNAVIGDCDPPIHEELMTKPISPYGASKLCVEAYCSAYNKTYGINTVILRFGNIYGPGSINKDSVIAKFIKESLHFKRLQIYGDGNQTRDFIYIDDLIDAVIKAANLKNYGGEIFQIAKNTETKILTLAKMIIQKIKRKGFKDINLIYKNKRIGDVLRNFSNTNKAKSKLDWKPKIELDEGLEKTIEYFIDKFSKKK